MLLAQAIEPASWPAIAQLGVTAMLLIWLVVKGNPKQRDDERADKVAVALAASEALALVKSEQREQVERHQKAYHDDRDRWQAMANAYETRLSKKEERIAKLTEALIELTRERSKGFNAADGERSDQMTERAGSQPKH